MALAIFDLDETLIAGDCASLWSHEMARLEWVDEERFLKHEAHLMAEYASGRLAMEDYMAYTLEPLVGRTMAEIEYVVTPFVEDVIEPLIYGDAMRCIATHRAKGDRILIISASPHFLVSAIANRLGIDEVLAIDVELEQGLINGKTKGVLTYQEGKVVRLQAWMEVENETLDEAYFYSDSRNDLPLLERVSHPRAVNPDSVLREHALSAAWPILKWT